MGYIHALLLVSIVAPVVQRMTMSKSVWGMLAVSTAAFLWGSIGVVVALLFGSIAVDGLMLGTLRLLIVVPFVWVWHRIASGHWQIDATTAQHRAMMIGGVAFAVYQVAYFAAIPSIGVAMAVMLNICSAPIFTALIARVWLGEQLRGSQWVAIALAISGAVLLVANPADMPSWSWLGVGYALGAGLCYSIVAVTTRMVAPAFGLATPLAYMFGVAALVLFVVTMTMGTAWPTAPAVWWGAVYLALVPTFLSYLLYVRGLQTITATTASTLSLCEPLTSTLLAVLILGEQLRLLAWIGAGLLFGSLVLFSLAHLWHPRQRA
jgi:DME family drug/metabolite transporter